MDAASGGVAAASASAPKRVMASTPAARSASIGTSSVLRPQVPREVLVIASRLKEFIDAHSGGFSTSQSVMDVLSDHLRVVCDRAIDNARTDGRKTVMERDFEFLKRS